MAQKGISYMNKVGSFQHWKDDFHSYNSQKITQQSFLFVEDVLKKFISSRNSFNSQLIDIDFCWDQIISLDCEVKNEDFNSLILSVRQQRIKRFMRLIVGKVVFLKYNKWLLILVYLFIPNLLRKVTRSFNSDFIKSRQFVKTSLINSIDYNNSTIYSKSKNLVYNSDWEVEEDFLDSGDDLDTENMSPEDVNLILTEKKFKLEAAIEKKNFKNIIKKEKLGIIKKINSHLPKISYTTYFEPNISF